MVRKVQKKQRGKITHQRKKLLIIGCEGKNKTEKNYFRHFNRIQSEYSICISLGNDTDPEGVINNSISTFKNEGGDYGLGDRIACCIDVDKYSERKEALQKAKRLAKKHKANIYFSNPCFEIWILLHFAYSTKTYNTNEELKREVQKYISGYEKSDDVFPIIYNDTDKAICNNNMLLQWHSKMGKTDILQMEPATQIADLVQSLRSNETVS